MIPALPPDPPAIVQQAQPVDDPFLRYGGKRLIVDPFVEYRGYAVPPAVEGRIQFHEKFAPLFQPHRYKVGESGRGAMKSWAFARALLILGQQRTLRILCGREYMSSIADSVHKLLKDQIEAMGLGYWYNVGKDTIRGANGTEFRFIGLGDMANRQNRARIKSFEAVDILWVEEAETITDRTWEVVIPTIRKKGSEIWISYNPNLATDATYKRFHVEPGEVDVTGRDIVTIRTSWRDNLWMTDEMRVEKDHAFATDPEGAAHIWDGALREHASATIFAGKCMVHAFPTPTPAEVQEKGIIFRHGVDWGHGGPDPTVMIRCWTTGVFPNEELWIDREAYKVKLELPDMGEFFDQKIIEPLSHRSWPVKADSANPTLISYMKNLPPGMQITGAEKWPNSIEDGIAHLMAFRKIHIHERCTHMKDEARLYSYKVDKMTGAVLPIVVDKWNHCWDAVRYALDGYIQRRGAASVWAQMGRQIRGAQV